MTQAAAVLAFPLVLGCQHSAPSASLGAAADAAGLANPGGDPPAVTLPRTEVRHLPSSNVEGVTYALYVALPRGYEDDTRRYPVVYLLDADYSFAIARNIVEHLADRGHLPPLLLVGVAYDGPPRYREHRTRDYTPSHVPATGAGPEAQRYSGGGRAFRQALADELIPFVERTYRASGERTLVGHSYGGLFATWVAFTAPELFANYLVVSPSLWYDERMVFGVEEAFAGGHDTLPVSLYFAVGTLEVNSLRSMPADLREFTRRVEQRAYRGLRQRVDVLDDETHNSVFPRALSNGLRTLLAGGASRQPSDGEAVP